MRPLVLLLAFALPSAAVEVDSVFHWNGAVATNLNPGSVGSLGAWETGEHTRWSVGARPSDITFPVTLTVGGTPINGSGTNWIVNDLNAQTGYDFISYNFGAAITNCVVAGFYMHTIPTGTAKWISLDQITLSSGGVGYNVFNLGLNGPSQPVYARIHSDGGHAAAAGLTPGKLYYYIMERNSRGGYAALSFYDPTNSYAFLGSNTVSLATNSTTYRMRFNSGYIGDVQGTAAYGPTMILVEPTDEDIAGLIQQPTFETVSNLVAVALAGDHVIIPAGTANWGTNTLYIDKRISVNFSGARITNEFGATSETAMISLHQPGTVVSNVFLFGNGTRNGAGFAVWTNGTRIAYCGLGGLDVGVWNYVSSNLVDNTWFAENDINARNYGHPTLGGKTLWDTLYPLPWTSTHYSFFEDCKITNATDLTGITLAGFEANQGGAYAVRHTDFYIGGLGDNYQPFDAHGDSTLTQRGTLGVQFYGNTFIWANGAYCTRFFDLRGGQSLIYSNTLSGYAGSAPWVIAREEDIAGDGSLLGRDGVTNTYCWNNTGLGGLTVKQDWSTNYIIEGVHVFNTAPAGLLAPPYPHPLRGGSSSPAEPPPEGTVGVTGSVAITGNVQINGQ